MAFHSRVSRNLFVRITYSEPSAVDVDDELCEIARVREDISRDTSSDGSLGNI